MRNLELLSPATERFHRIYRGEHIRCRDKVIVHLFDLSASDQPKADCRLKPNGTYFKNLVRVRSFLVCVF